MRRRLIQIVEVFFKNNLAIFQDKQSVDVQALRDLIDGSFLAIKKDREIIDIVRSAIQREYLFAVFCDPGCRDDLSHVAEGPAVLGAELKVGERQRLRSVGGFGGDACSGECQHNEGEDEREREREGESQSRGQG